MSLEPIRDIQKRENVAPLNEPDHALSLGEIFGRGWYLFRFQSGKSMLAGAIGWLPIALLMGIVMGLAVAVDMTILFVCLPFLEILLFLYLPLVVGSIIHLTSAAHYGEVIGIRKAYARTWKTYRNLMPTLVLFYLMFILGLICFIVPGIIIMLRYGLSWILVVVENIGVRESFQRSRTLLESRKGPFSVIQFLYFSILFTFVALLVLLVIATVDVEFLQQFWGQFLFQVFFQEFEIVFFVVPFIPVMTAFYFDAEKRLRLQTTEGENNL